MRAAIITVSSSRAAAGATNSEGDVAQKTRAPADDGAQKTRARAADGTQAAAASTDDSGERLAEFARGLGAEIAGRDLIPDDLGAIEERLRHWADVESCELVLTTGGTGFAPSDLTPEATLAVIERQAPGIAEAMRAASRAYTPHWMLSRAVAGIRGTSLIVNFPGSPASIAQAGEAIAPALPHAVQLLAGKLEGASSAH
jgi:molybdopterin adenylyltransferase